MDRNFLSRLKAIVPGWATYDYLPPFRKEILLTRKAKLDEEMEDAWDEHQTLKYAQRSPDESKRKYELSKIMDYLDKEMQNIDETMYREKL